MREVELIDMSNQEEIPITASCWHCNEGGNKGKLISPCKCTNQFVHIHCLKISANTWNVLHCQFCHTQYLLEIKHKSLLKCCRNSSILLQMLREICAPLFKILILIFCYLFFISIIVYVIISYVYDMMKDYNIFIVIFMIIMYLCGLLFFIYATVPIMIHWSNRICEICYKSTQEIKLRQYPNVRVI